MLLGLIFVILGVVLAAFWWHSFVVILQGALILSLFFWGVIVFLIGFSRRKAHREYARALHDEADADVVDAASDSTKL